MAKKQLAFESTVKKLLKARKDNESLIEELKVKLENNERLLDQKVTRMKQLEEENRHVSGMFHFISYSFCSIIILF